MKNPLQTLREQVEAMRNKWARQSVWKETYRAGYNNAIDDVLDLIDTLEKEEKICGIVEKWMETSNPAYVQDLFDLLTPSPNTKEV